MKTKSTHEAQDKQDKTIRVLEIKSADSAQTNVMLQEAEENYRSIFENANEAIFIAQAGKLVFLNPMTTNLIGYSPDELKSRPFVDFIHADDRNMVVDRHIRRMRGEPVPPRYSFRIVHRDGYARWVELNAVQIKWHGEPAVLNFLNDITERKKAESALRQSEELFRLAFHTSPDSINLNAAADGTYIDINEGFTKTTGYTRADVLGKTSLSLNIWENPEDCKRLVGALFKTGWVENVEARFVMKDGTVRDGLMSARLIRINESDIVLSITRDITERKQAEAVARESLSLLEATIESTADGILVADGKGRIARFNRQFAEMWRLSDDVLKSRDDEKALSFVLEQLKDPSSFLQKVRELYASPEKSSFDILEFKDGRCFERYSQPQWIGDFVAGRVWSFRDITERQQAENALRESEEKFRTLVEKSPLGISLIGKDGRYKYLNPQFHQLFGYTIDDTPTGSAWFRQAFPDDTYRKAVVNTWIQDQQQISIGQSRPRIYTVTCKDGSRKKIHFRPVTMENMDQFVIYEDITEKTRMERQFQQAQKFEAIGTLAGGIAHDFNNLLMGIQGRASLMSIEPTTSHKLLEHIHAIEEYVRSATDLTKQLLGFARGGKYEAKPIDVNELVSNSALMFGRTKKEIRIHTKMHDPSPVVEADQGQLEQVLLNLYVNAWQAMPDGGELYLETKIVTLDEAYSKAHRVTSGRYCKISVTDTGIGMDNVTRQRIFDPFFTTKEKTRGTGLGLASAYGIIHNHGGIITVRSELGYGATFDLYLPVSDKDVHREVNAKEGLIKGSGTILLVDDEEIVVDVAQAMLENLGYRVITASGGEEALNLVEKQGQEIDLVVLDMIMPGMDGGKTFDHVRALRPDMPVLLSSGYAIDGQAKDIMKRGCNGFIQKPFSIVELSKKIHKIVDETNS
jgi:PAS domain S-box-containing protein